MLTALTKNESPVRIPVKGDAIAGDLCVPREAKGIVVLAYGSGGNRRSPELKVLLLALQKARIATLAVDLLTDEENKVEDNRANLDLLTDRLLSVIHWIWSNDRVVGLKIGLFGAGTGATTVFKIAGRLGEVISAIVSRGASYDLVQNELHRVKAPTLLLVSNHDGALGDWNARALTQLCCYKKTEVIPGTSALFKEDGAVECVASLATTWFRKYLRDPTDSISVVPMQKRELNVVK